MMKFELARKYLVGFLALAVLTMSLTLPLSAPIAPVAAADLNAGPVLDGAEDHVGLVMTSTNPRPLPRPLPPHPTQTSTHSLTATIWTGAGQIPPLEQWVLFQVSLQGVVKLAKTVTVPANSGTATVAFDPSEWGLQTTATTYQCIAYWVTSSTTNPIGALASSAASNLEWAAAAATTLLIDPATETNTLPDFWVDGDLTHTVTLWVKDQWGDPFSFSGTVPMAVGGALTPSPASQDIGFGATPTKQFTFTVTDPYNFLTNPPQPRPIPPSWTNTLVATPTFGAAANATKIWTYTPTFGELWLTPETATNVAGQTHTLTAYFLDWAGYLFPITGTGTLTWSVTGANTKPATATTFTNTSFKVFSYVGTKAGDDVISATVAFDGLAVTQSGSPPFETATATKHWDVDGGIKIAFGTGTTTLVNTPITLTATVTDLYDNPVTGTTVYFFSNPTAGVTLAPTALTNASGTATVAVTSTKGAPAPGYLTTITASLDSVVTKPTVAIYWLSKTATRGGYNPGDPTSTSSTWYNMLPVTGSGTHTVRYYIMDEYGNVPSGLTATSYVEYVITGANPTVSTTKALTSTTFAYVDVTWTAVNAGLDTIVFGTLYYGNNETLALPHNHGYKFWAHEYNVGPLEAINALGTEHEFVIKGAPFQPFTGQLYQNDHGLIKITEFNNGPEFKVPEFKVDGNEFHPTHTLTVHSPNLTNVGVTGPETPFSDSHQFSGMLGESGTATIVVYGKSPYKFYMEVNFDQGLIYGNTRGDFGLNSDKDPWESYLFSSFNALRNPLIERHWQVAKIYAYLTRSSTTLMPATATNAITPSLTLNQHTVSCTVWGKYLLNGTWSAEVPVQNARVDWTVTWTDAYGRTYIGVTVPGGQTATTNAKALCATSYTDANGKATLTYALTPTDALLVPGPLTDTIVGYDHYSDAVLDLDYPPPAKQYGEKKWLDYPFKLIKIRNQNYNDVMPGVEFFLKIKTSSATYFYGVPSAAYISVTDTAGWFKVKTDTNGEAAFLHLPFGEYELWEITPSGYVGYPGTVLADSSIKVPDNVNAWTGPLTSSIMTRYYSNTPSTPGPLTYTGSAALTKYWQTVTDSGLLSGAGFRVQNVSTGTWYPTPATEYVTNPAGYVNFPNLPADTPTGVPTWYMVREIYSPYGGLVPDFYFFLPPGGGYFNGNFFTDTTSSPTYAVWPGGKVYDPRTPTTPTGTAEFNKRSYCYTWQSEWVAKFTAQNLTTLVISPEVTASATGLVRFTGLTASPTSLVDTWYKVHETLAPTPLLVVNDFYFRLQGQNGLWDQVFRATPTITALEVWPYMVLPLYGGASAHWVIDQRKDAAFVNAVTIDPPTDGPWDLTQHPTQGFTVTVFDQNNIGLSGETVAPALSGITGSFNPLSAVTDAYGKATFILTASSSGTANVLVTLQTSGHPSKDAHATYSWYSTNLAINGLTLSPTKDVSAWNPISVGATSPKPGAWSGIVYNALGVKIGDLPGGSGLTYSPTWAPGIDQQGLTGDGNYAVIYLTDGTATINATTPLFDIYNYKAKILSVELWDSSLIAPITNPHTGIPFFVKVTIKNVYSGIITTAIVPVMLGVNYLGAGALGGLPSGAEGSVAILANKLTGTYTCYAYVWPSFGGAPIAPVFSFSVNVIP